MEFPNTEHTGELRKVVGDTTSLSPYLVPIFTLLPLLLSLLPGLLAEVL